jgi:hypothetical protein
MLVLFTDVNKLLLEYKISFGPKHCTGWIEIRFTTYTQRFSLEPSFETPLCLLQLIFP